jgi:hypothetical protein
MTPYQKRATEITLRMAQDMKIRNMADSTIDSYTYCQFAPQTVPLVCASNSTSSEIRDERVPSGTL